MDKDRTFRDQMIHDELNKKMNIDKTRHQIKECIN